MPAVITISVYAVLFGVTMKVADLLDEHGLEWFSGSDILFGLFWGMFGALLMMQSAGLATFLCALVIHWVLRYRIDYLNHGLAATIMLVTFLFIYPEITFSWNLFGITLLGFSFHGLLNDAADRDWIDGLWAKYFESNIHWVWMPLALSIYNPSYWIITLVSTLFIVSYELTKHFGMKLVEKQKR